MQAQFIRLIQFAYASLIFSTFTSIESRACDCQNWISSQRQQTRAKKLSFVSGTLLKVVSLHANNNTHIEYVLVMESRRDIPQREKTKKQKLSVTRWRPYGSLRQ